jgi:iron(III) transport system permease protein
MTWTARRWGEVAGLGLVLLLAWLVLYPILLVVFESLELPGSAWQLVEWNALWNSVWISLASVALAAAIGVPLAFIYHRYAFPGRAVLGALIALPAVLPPLVGVVAFDFLYGEAGFISRAVRWALGLESAPWRLHGAGAILLVHAYSMYVYFYLFTRAGLARLDASMGEAAAALGASRWTTLRRVTLPLLRPSLIGAALLTFMTALASFSAPYIFGGAFPVMTTQIVRSKQNGDLAAATVETVVLAAVALVGLAIFRWLEGSAAVAVRGKGIAPKATRLDTPLQRGAAATAGWALAILLLLPHATLLLLSFVPFGSWTTEFLPPTYSVHNYVALVNDPARLRPLVNSVWLATAATAGAVAIGVLAGWLVIRRRVQLAKVIEGLLALPWALPGTVFAIALATTFSVADPLKGRIVLVGTAWILLVAYLARNLPIAGRAVIAGFRQLDSSYEEAAQALGAGRWMTLRRVTLPLLRPAIAAGASLAFVTALGDFVASIVLYSYDSRPISIEILSNLRQVDIGAAAAYGVVLMVLSAVALGVGSRRLV